MNYTYSESKNISKEDLVKLYSDNEWLLYTKNPDGLHRAVKNSLYVKSVWEENELIGLIRVVGDNESIIYIQDILVLRKYHRRGIGTKLMSAVLEKFKHVRQKVLLTGKTDKQAKFYRSLGFVEPSDIECAAFVRHDI